jgi:telomere length regulation protein
MYIPSVQRFVHLSLNSNRALIEEFYKNQYSVDQRHIALNALAIGARELASLPVPSSRFPENKSMFPSKKLPQRLHQQYLAASQANTSLLPLMVENLSRKAIDRGKEATEDKVPEVVREKRLTIKRTPRISEIKGHVQPLTRNDSEIKTTTFTDVAAEYFICPLINHFWLFLRDEQTREERTSQRGGRQKYHSAGTGLILNPLVLSQLLRALSILVNASRNAPEWLAIIAPDSLELAVTIGSRPVSITEQNNEESKEAAVLTAALELTLIVLDGCIESDGGKSLGLDHTTLLFGTGEWAGAVFAKLEKGIRVEGGGGLNEVKLQRAAAGVLLKVDELTSRWKRSMVDTR